MPSRSDLRPIAAVRPRAASAERTRPRAGGRPWRIRAEGDGPADVFVFDTIGFWGVEADDFAREVAALSGRELHVRINSPGGDVFDGLAMYNTLLQHDGRVVSTVEGLAASAASFIALAADEVRVMRASQMMIHDAWGIAIGPAADMRAMAEVLDGVSDTLAATYARAAGGTADSWRDLMRAETWYRDGAASVEAGLADVVIDPPRGRHDDDDAPASAWEAAVFAQAPPEPSGDATNAAAARMRAALARASGVAHLDPTARPTTKG